MRYHFEYARNCLKCRNYPAHFTLPCLFQARRLNGHLTSLVLNSGVYRGAERGESPRAALKRGRHFEWGGKRGKIDVTMLCARMKPEGVRTLHLSIIISIFCANRTQNWTAIIYREWVKLALGKANSEDVVHPAPVALAKIGLPDTGRSILCQ